MTMIDSHDLTSAFFARAAQLWGSASNNSVVRRRRSKQTSSAACPHPCNDSLASVCEIYLLVNVGNKCDTSPVPDEVRYKHAFDSTVANGGAGWPQAG